MIFSMPENALRPTVINEQHVPRLADNQMKNFSNTVTLDAYWMPLTPNGRFQAASQMLIAAPDCLVPDWVMNQVRANRRPFAPKVQSTDLEWGGDYVQRVGKLIARLPAGQALTCRRKQPVERCTHRSGDKLFFGVTATRRKSIYRLSSRSCMDLV